MRLIVGTESTWSLRAWMCGQLANQDVTVEVIDLSADNYKTELYKRSATGLVPALIHQNQTIHDSLAIMEYFNECASGALLPQSRLDRAYARSLCAELHSGFMQIRTHCPFSTEPVAPLERLQLIESELSRLKAIFASAHLPFMFDSVTAVDVFYAILAYRLTIYGVNFDGQAGKYQKALTSWSLLEQAIEQARDWNNSCITRQ